MPRPFSQRVGPRAAPPHRPDTGYALLAAVAALAVRRATPGEEAAGHRGRRGGDVERRGEGVDQ